MYENAIKLCKIPWKNYINVENCYIFTLKFSLKNYVKVQNVR